MLYMWDVASFALFWLVYVGKALANENVDAIVLFMVPVWTKRLQ